MEKLILFAMVMGLATGFLALWGQSRYEQGYETAMAEAEKHYQTAAETLRQQQHQASQTYQAAKAEREAAERIRKENLYEITQRTDYSHLCFDADGLRELNNAIGKK